LHYQGTNELVTQKTLSSPAVKTFVAFFAEPSLMLRLFLFLRHQAKSSGRHLCC